MHYSIHTMSNAALAKVDTDALPAWAARMVKSERIRRHCAKVKKGPAQAANSWRSPRVMLARCNVWDGYTHKMPDGSTWVIPPQTQGSLKVMYEEQQARKAAECA